MTHDNERLFYQGDEQTRLAILTVLNTGECLFPREIAARSGYTSNSIRNTLRHMYHAGTLVRHKNAVTAQENHYTYQLAQQELALW